MAAIQPFVNLQPFKGTEAENNEEFFRQLPQATREDYDNAAAALRERYKNDQHTQLQKLKFQARKLQPSEESVQDFLTELQRLALEAYPDIQARAAAGGRPAVVPENRANERTRRVKVNFINGMPIKLGRFLLTQPEDSTVDERCAKAASRMIVDRLYPEEDDSAFNEIRGTSSEDFFAGIEELSKTQTKFNTETTKITDELMELSKNLNSASLNEMSSDNQNNANQNTSNNRGNYRGNYRGNNRGNYRGNSQGNYRGNNYQHQGPYKQNNRQNWRGKRGPWNNQYRLQFGRVHCNIRKKLATRPQNVGFENSNVDHMRCPTNK